MQTLYRCIILMYRTHYFPLYKMRVEWLERSHKIIIATWCLCLGVSVRDTSSGTCCTRARMCGAALQRSARRYVWACKSVRKWSINETPVYL